MDTLSHPGPSGHPKVAIPRIARPPSPAQRGPDSTNKTKRTCVKCRERKVKCDGKEPTCSNCEGGVRACVYIQGRRNRFKTATELNQNLVTLLKDLKRSVTDDEKLRIDDFLNRIKDDITDAASQLDLPQSPISNEAEGEAIISADTGSNGDTDVVDADILHDKTTLSTGFVGQGSEVQWLRHLKEQAAHPKEVSINHEGPYGPPGSTSQASLQRMEALKKRQERNSGTAVAPSTCSFYLDDEELDVDFQVISTDVPPFDTAQKLVDCYMTTVQDDFPILDRRAFLAEFQSYYGPTGGVLSGVSPRWLAILNLVFAIGARYSHLIELEWQADERDHLVYQSRAYSLTINEPIVVSMPNVHQVQLTALLSFYFLVLGRVNRAWLAVGISLRYAHTLGLHLRNEDRNVPLSRKESLLHTWWSVCCLEGITGIVVGRPSFVVEDYCSAPLPLPLTADELEQASSQSQALYRVSELDHRSLQADQGSSDPSNSASYLKSIVQIVLLAQRAMADIYSARVVVRSWKQVQQTISMMCKELEAWLASLPIGLDFTKPSASGDLDRQRMTLALHYFGTKLLLTRPCLCRLDGRIPKQSKTSASFNRQTARTCVGSAKAMTDLLPNDADAISIYRIAPWWSLVHFLVQALVVLLFEISYGTVHFSEQTEEILPSAKKIIRWLRSLSKTDQIAERAYVLLFDVLRELAPQIEADITDILSEHAEFAESHTMIPTTVAYAAPPPMGIDEQQFGQEWPADAYYNVNAGLPPAFRASAEPLHGSAHYMTTSAADMAGPQSPSSSNFTTHYGWNSSAHPNTYAPLGSSFTTRYDEYSSVYPHTLFRPSDAAMPDASEAERDDSPLREPHRR